MRFASGLRSAFPLFQVPTRVEELPRDLKSDGRLSGACRQGYSTEEMRERLALTEAIVANLKAINEENNDLEDMRTLSHEIVGNPQLINADKNNLDELANQNRFLYFLNVK
jgi:hypothetical protein